jgi:hypothetical protein
VLKSLGILFKCRIYGFITIINSFIICFIATFSGPAIAQSNANDAIPPRPEVNQVIIGEAFNDSDGNSLIQYVSINGGSGAYPNSDSKVFFYYNIVTQSGELIQEGIASHYISELDQGVAILLRNMREGSNLNALINLYRDQSVWAVGANSFLRINLRLIAIKDPAIYPDPPQPFEQSDQDGPSAINDRVLANVGTQCTNYIVIRGYGPARPEFPAYEDHCGIQASLAQAAEFGRIHYVRMHDIANQDQTYANPNGSGSSIRFSMCKKYMLQVNYSIEWHEIGTYCLASGDLDGVWMYRLSSSYETMQRCEPNAAFCDYRRMLTQSDVANRRNYLLRR